MNIFLESGELHISEKPAIVSTVLGSCGAVTIFNKTLRIGGICRILFPRKQTPNGATNFRYSDSLWFSLSDLGSKLRSEIHCCIHTGQVLPKPVNRIPGVGVL
jgi:chemotaxis receptor (MCP) glutamine deamidase CheD